MTRGALLDTSASPPNWVDLLDVSSTDSVLISPALAPAVAARLAERAGTVTVARSAAACYDLIVLDAACARSDLDTIVPALRPGGRLGLLASNPLSPLRLADRARRRPVGATAGPYPVLRRRLARAGLPATAVFALLRDPEAPTTAFRVDLTDVAVAALVAARSGAGRLRRFGVGGLELAARAALAVHLVPGWLVVASHEPIEVRSCTPTGRMGVAENEQGALLLGAGPDAVEKRFDDPARIETIAAALAEIEAAGIDVGTRIVGRVGGDRLRMSWVSGQPLDPFRLDPEDLERWLGRAAGLLGRIHAATIDARGDVRVHGDFWLACLVVERGHLNGVIDWSDTHRGPADEDLRTLLDVVETRADLDAGMRRELRRRTLAAHARAGGPAAARLALEQPAAQG